jgi:sulfatase maturation enzyme AslB (radical SAM superfamily)
LSSSWEEESRRLNVDVSAPKTDEQKVLNELEPIYDYVEEVYFAGGEPLISDHHYHIIDKLLEKDLRPTIRYNTNLSTLTYKGRDIIDIWKNFPNIELFVSFDGIGKRGELIRKGFDSKRFIKNILRIQKELPHLQINYNFVVYILNAYHFVDAHEFMVDHGILRSFDSISFTLLKDPQYLRITTLDSESKKEVLEIITKSRFRSNYDMIYKFLLKEDNSSYIPQFKFMTDGLDAVRNENTLEIIPELHRLLK